MSFRFASLAKQLTVIHSVQGWKAVKTGDEICWKGRLACVLIALSVWQTSIFIGTPFLSITACRPRWAVPDPSSPKLERVLVVRKIRPATPSRRKVGQLRLIARRLWIQLAWCWQAALIGSVRRAGCQATTMGARP